MLAKVDVDANPQLSQAFRAQSIPMVVALVGGQPVPLFTGAVPEQQVREVLAQLLQLAAQNGVTGTRRGRRASRGRRAAPVEPPLPPLHAEAYDAIEAGDYPRAIAAYEKALAENPRDADARPASDRCACSTACRASTCRRPARPPRPTPTGIDAQFARRRSRPRRRPRRGRVRPAPRPVRGAARRTSAGRCASGCSSCSRSWATPTPACISARGRLASLLF